MRLKEAWSEYYRDPFGFVDRLELTFKGFKFNFLNFLATYKETRKAIFVFVLFSASLWAIMGFDSCALQLQKLIVNLPSVLIGKMSWGEYFYWYNWYYGKEMHWSSFVIYGLCFVGLSHHYEDKLGITKSKNMVYSFALTLFSIPFFEFAWMLCYGMFQGQWWVLKFQWPQIRILMQNIVFLITGGLVMLYMYCDDLRFRYNWKTIMLIGLSLAGALLWIFYPFHVQQITVETTTGPWVSSTNFPQTLYTVETDPLDNVNAGEWYYVPNDGVHAMNIFVKVLFTLTIFYFAKASRVHPIFREESEESSLLYKINRSD